MALLLKPLDTVAILRKSFVPVKKFALPATHTRHEEKNVLPTPGQIPRQTRNCSRVEVRCFRADKSLGVRRSSGLRPQMSLGTLSPAALANSACLPSKVRKHLVFRTLACAT